MARLACVALAFCAPAVAAEECGTVEFSSPAYQCMEPTAVGTTTNVTITVNRANGSSGAVSVAYCCWTADGLDTAEGYQSASSPSGTVYYYRDVQSARVHASGRLQWSDGETAPKTFNVPLTADAWRLYTNATIAMPRIEGTKTVSIALANPGGGVMVGAQSSARIEILDAQAPPSGVLHFSRPRFFGGEKTGNAVVTVKRTCGSAGIVSARYTVNNFIPPNMPGATNLPKAAPGTDYVVVTGTLLWADGDAGDKEFVVPVNDDSSAEGPELANLALFSSSGAPLGTWTNAVLTLVDDDKDLADVAVCNMPSTQVRIWNPQNVPVLRGMFVYMAGSGGDSRWMANWKSDWKAICKEWGFAFMGTMVGTFVQSSSGPAGIGDFLDIMRESGEYIGRPELANAPVIFTGYSLGGLYSAYSSMALPERTVGWAGYMGGWSLSPPYDCLKNVPCLFIAGQKDNNSIVGAPLLRNMFLTWRTNGCPAAYAVSWGVAHKDDEGQSYETALLYLNEVLKYRYPTNQFPGAEPGQTVRLNPVDMSNGWFGITTVYNAPVWDLKIAPATNFLADPATASWMPSEAAARYYRAFTTVYSSYYPNNFPAVKPFQSPPSITPPAAFAIYTQPATVDITMDYRVFAAIPWANFYFEAAQIASLTVSPWAVSLSLSNMPGGPYGITCEVNDGLTTRKHGLQLFTVQTPDPPRSPSRLSAGSISNGVVLLSWQDNANNETGMKVARRALDEGAWTNVAALAAGATSWTDMDAAQDGVHAYRVCAFNDAGDSGWCDERLVAAAANTWSGNAGNASWDTAANWLGAALPDAGAAVVFPEKGALAPYSSGGHVMIGEDIEVTGITFMNRRMPTGDITISSTGGASVVFGPGGRIDKPSGDANEVNACGVRIGVGGLRCSIAGGSVAFNGAITETAPAGIVKDGAGILALGGIGAYQGGTIVSNGVLMVNNAMESACGPGPVAIAVKGILGGSGYVAGIVSNEGVIAPGTSTGTLRVAALVLAPSSRANFEIGEPEKGWDRIVVDGDMTLDGTVNITNLSDEALGTYTLFSCGGALVNNGLALGAVPPALYVELLTNQIDSIQVKLTPEPGCVALAAGLLALAPRRGRQRP
ncbi:hypothetical protein GX586_15130 [bacterium]|nr:hypothetical protein [bacterium]